MAAAAVQAAKRNKERQSILAEQGQAGDDKDKQRKPLDGVRPLISSYSIRWLKCRVRVVSFYRHTYVRIECENKQSTVTDLIRYVNEGANCAVRSSSI